MQDVFGRRFTIGFGVFVLMLSLIHCDGDSTDEANSVAGAAGQGVGLANAGVCQDTITWSDPQGLGCSSYKGLPCTGEAAQNCPLSCGLCSSALPGGSGGGQNNNPVQCDGFLCQSGDCIEYSKFCDGLWNCPAGEDELSCDTEGGTGGGNTSGGGGSESSTEGGECEFDCGDGYCISSEWVCDGNPDCNEGEDEFDCEGTSPCEFECFDGSCVSTSVICNGVEDCAQGEDEKGCGSSGGGGSNCDFLCNNGECIPEKWVCDGEEDCNAGEDEFGCESTAEGGSGGDPCASYCPTGECLTEDQLCNGVMDCPDGDDEAFCPGGESNEGGGTNCEYLCNNGECIPKKWVCDGEADCNSGEDEENCGGGSTPTGSCAGYCGEQAPTGCFCDDQCSALGDCCDDICIMCPELNSCLYP